MREVVMHPAPRTGNRATADYLAELTSARPNPWLGPWSWNASNSSCAKMSLDSKTDDETPLNTHPVLRCGVNILEDYCRHSGVHGLRYLSEHYRNRFEKLFWVIAIAVSTLGCVMMIAKIKTKMDTTPIIVTLADNPTKVWHIPFPAVTLCPGATTRSTTFNFTKYADLAAKDPLLLDDFLKWVNESKLERGSHYNGSFQFLESRDELNGSSLFENSTERNSLYKKLWALATVSGLLDVQPTFSTNETLALDENDMDFLLEVAPDIPVENIPAVYSSVFWKSKTYYLFSHFKHLWTEYGMCFTFNMMDDIYVYRDKVVNNEVFKRKGLDDDFPKSSSNNWDPDKGYTNMSSRESYPWRIPHERSSERKLLRIKVAEKREDMSEYWGKEYSDYMLIFHQPQDHPQRQLHTSFRMPFQTMLDVSMDVDVMTTSPELESYDPRQRQCYYSYERPLEYFKIYSLNNCQLECITNYSLRMCGCVAFYMPRYNTTKICGRDAFNCLADAALQADENEMDAALKDLSESGKSPFYSADKQSECDCLPSCFSIEYKADFVSAEDLTITTFYDSTYVDKIGGGEDFAIAGVHVKFEKRFFIANQRNEYYGQVEFLANCGGFLGLCCGFSVLSLVEIIYFFTIRLWTNIYRRLTCRPPASLPGGPSVRKITLVGAPSRRTPQLTSTFGSKNLQPTKAWDLPGAAHHSVWLR